MSSTVNETGRMFGGRNAAASALLTSARLELRMKLSSIFTGQSPSYSAVS